MITKIILLISALMFAVIGSPAMAEFIGAHMSGGEYNPQNLSAVEGTDYVYPIPGEIGHGYVGGSEASYVHSRGMNIIRLAFDIRRLQPTNLTALNTTELAYIQAEVTKDESLGMRVILDPHQYGKMWSTPDNAFEYITAAPAYSTAFNDFWTRLTVAFQSDPSVIFGLMNEPDNTSGTAAQWKTAAASAVSAIRTAESPTVRHLILIPGVGYTNAGNWSFNNNDTAWAGYTDPVGGPFMFEMHQYLDTSSAGNGPVCLPGVGSTSLVSATTWARANGFKILLGEMNWWQTTQCFTEGPALVNYTRANADVWAGWVWCCSGPWAGANTVNLYDIDTIPAVPAAQWNLLSQLIPTTVGSHRLNAHPGTPVGQVTFIASAVASSSTGSLSCPVPTGTQNGDLMLTYLSNPSDTTYTALNSWNVGGTASAGLLHSVLFFRFANTEPSSYAWTGLGLQSECLVRTYRNVTSIALFDDLQFTGNASALALATSPLTPTVNANEMNVSFWSAFSSTQAISGPGGLLNTQADHTQISVYAGDVLRPLAGTTVTARTASITGATSPWVSVAVNLLGTSSPVPASLNFSLTSPTNLQIISGTASPFTGQAGNLWAGVNIYAGCQPLTKLIPSNVVPASGLFSGSIDTTQMANGAQSLQAAAFKADGTPSAPIPVSVTVNNAAITFIGQTIGTSASGPTTLVQNIPAGTQVGDVLLAYVVTQAATPGTTPVGWTLSRTATNTIQSSTLYWKVAASGDVGGTVSFASVSQPVAEVRDYRGVYTAGVSPIDASALCVQSSSASCTVPALAATQSNAEVEVGFWDYNPTTTVTCPATFGHITQSTTQRGFCTGDVTIGLQGVVPPAATATGATANVWDAIAATLLTGPAILLAPQITSNPQNQTVNSGSQATFNIVYTGSPPFTVQWYKIPPGGNTGSPVGTNSNSYQTPSLTSADNGEGFYAIVTNAQGAATSTIASLTVPSSTPPNSFVVSSPAPNATVSGAASPVTTTSGTTWVNVACFFSGTKVCADTTPTCVSGTCTASLALNTTGLPIPNGTQTINFIAFSVPAGQPGGTQAQVDVPLNVCNGCGPAPPVIASGQPVNQTATVGSQATFTVSVTGNPTPTCVWSKNGTAISPPANSCVSYTTPTLALTDNNETFSVAATNTQGSATSRSAVLTVTSVGPSNTFDAFGMPNPPPSPNNTRAVPAIAFNTSIGANVCGNSSCCFGCANGSGSQATDIAEEQYVGILTMRTDHSNLPWMINIANGAATGPASVGKPKYCMLMFNDSTNVTTADLTNTEMASAISLNNAGVLRCLESSNEPNTQNDTYNGVQCGCVPGQNCHSVAQGGVATDWKSCAQMSHDFRALLRANSSLNNIAFYGISDQGAEIGDYGLQCSWTGGTPCAGNQSTYNHFYPNGTQYFDGGVQHNYNGGGGHCNPRCTNQNEQWDFASPSNNSSVGYVFYQDYEGLWGGCCSGISAAQAADVINFPRITTEEDSDSDGGLEYQAVAVTNTYIDYFARGIKVSERFGLVTPSENFYQGFYNISSPSFANGAPFKSADYVHSMTHFLTDTGDVVSPGTVNWSFTSGCPTGGHNGDSLCHGILLQKSPSAVWNPGSYDLLLTYEPGQGGAAVTPTVSFGTTFSQINVYDITRVVSPSQNSPSNPTPVASCQNCSSISWLWNALGHLDNIPCTNVLNQQGNLQICAPQNSPTPPPVVIELISGSTNAGPVPAFPVPGGVAALTFNDTFTNIQTDLTDSNTHSTTANWYTGSVGCCHGQILSRINQSNSSYSQIAGGGMGITYTWPSPAGQGGALSTFAPDGSGGFHQTYGYFEAKIQVPPGTGSWPAWWMQNLINENSFANTPSNFINDDPAHPATGDWEIDMPEWYPGTGSNTGNNEIQFALIDYPIGGSSISSGGAGVTPSSLSVGYHIYGMLWTASTITYWVDGVQYFSLPTLSFMHSPGYMMLDQGNNAPWNLTGAQVTQPATLNVQYVRVWAIP